MTSLDLTQVSEPNRNWRLTKWMKDRKEQTFRTTLIAPTARDLSTETRTGSKNHPWSIRFWMRS